MASLKSKKILITCGPTWVPVDTVRVISNISTGELGHQCATAMSRQGAKVTLLEGPVQKPLTSRTIRIKKFVYFNDLKQALTDEMKKGPDIVIHAAAVSDYRINHVSAAKLSSDRGHLSLDLVPTPKLIRLIKKTSPKSFLVGFKLEDTVNPDTPSEQVRRLFRSAGCDLIVQNKIKEGYRAVIIGREDGILQQAGSKAALVKWLTEILRNRL